MNIELAKEAIKKADAVCFDVDSTVITEEGIDVLATSLGVGYAVSKLTASAMGGTTLFQNALKARLDLIKPSIKNLENIQKEHPLQFTPRLKELIEILHKKGKNIYLVSGGFRQMINPIALQLGISVSNIYAIVMSKYSVVLFGSWKRERSREFSK